MTPDDIKPASNFNPYKKTDQPVTIQDIQEINNNFWNTQSVNLHRCYTQGHVYANNSNKKTSINLIQDLFSLLRGKYAEGNTHSEQINIIFNNIKNNLELIEGLSDEVDKNCILSIIQGYTLGCLKKYEK